VSIAEYFFSVFCDGRRVQSDSVEIILLMRNGWSRSGYIKSICALS